MFQTHRRRFTVAVLILSLIMSLSAFGLTSAQDDDDEIIVGLITKTETNPFFVKMREGAQQKVDELREEEGLNIELLTAAGEFDGDNASQVAAIENMTAAGADGILITPSDTAAIVPSIQRARDQGVFVIALDTATNPQDATDALFATDNFQAGVRIGEYARAAMDNPDEAVIALLTLQEGITVGDQREGGFLEGFGISSDSEQVVCEQATQGNQARGQTAMENCLVGNPDINLVYTINEPAAFGAHTALENAESAEDTMIVSVDGGCAGIEAVMDGRIDATSQQYPLRMASLGVEAVVEYAQTGSGPTGYTDTGVTLITNNPVEGIESEDVLFGIENCWGEPSDGAIERAEEMVGDDGEMIPEATEEDSLDLQAEIAAMDEEVIVGLITKTETNPFFVKMREGAQQRADELGIELLTAAGEFDGDNASQVAAIENMVSAGAQGILITPSDTSAIVPSIERARDEGVIVIALDTPTNPQDATDALFATDNFQAGVRIGEYARAAMDNPDEAVIAILTLQEGITVGDQRESGFLEGFGISSDSEQVVCEQATQGNQARGQTAMENCLVGNPDINLVYTINEPAAFGAYTALENAGSAEDTMIVSIDGGCAGVEAVADGRIDATSQQYPLRMASLGVEAVARAAVTGDAPEGYTNTGVTLITDNPVDSVSSEDTEFGLENCWG